MTLPVFSLMFFGSGAVLLSFFVLLKRWDPLSRSWLYFSIAVSIYAFAYAYFSNNGVDSRTALLAARIGTTAAAVIPLTWFYFVSQFLNIKQKKIFWITGPFTFLFIAVGMSGLFIPAVAPAKSYLYYPTPGPFYYPHVLNFFGVVGYAFFLLARSYLNETDEETRKGILSLLIATIVGFIAGSSEFSLILFRDRGFDLTVFLVFYPFLMAYAMIRHRALDIEKIADAFQREKLAAIGILSASVNHELKSPLFVAKGSLESYLQNMEEGIHGEDGLKEASRKAAQTAIRQLIRASEIMQRLTDFARPDMKGEKSEKIFLHEALKDVLELVHAHLRANKINLAVEVGDEIMITANRRQLEEIIFNLIINACQAMKDGGKLAIFAARHHESVQIEIRDEGPGISPDQLSKIFEPFYTTKETGTGLGLYITKQLVERNKGRISVETQLNKGTRFILSFPEFR